MRKLFCLILLVALSGSLQAQNAEVTTIDLVNQSIEDCKAQYRAVWPDWVSFQYHWVSDIRNAFIPEELRNNARRITSIKNEMRRQSDVLNSMEISNVALNERQHLSNNFLTLSEYEDTFLFIAIEDFEYLCTLLARKDRNEDNINDVKQKLHTSIVELEFNLTALEKDIGMHKQYDSSTKGFRR